MVDFHTSGHMLAIILQDMICNVAIDSMSDGKDEPRLFVIVMLSPV